MKTGAIFFAIILIGLSSCRKKEALPQNVEADPIFYLKATISGAAVNLQAGNAGYYMHSSFEKDDNDIYVFRGDLSSDCSTACGYSLSVLIKDRLASETTSVKIDSAIVLGQYNLLTKDLYPTEQEVTFVPKEAQSGAKSYTWTVIDENGEIVSSQSYSFSASLKISSTYTVTYHYEDNSGGCSGTHSNIYVIGGKFRTWMSIQKNGTDVSFTAATDKAGQYTYTWDFGDGSQGEGMNISHHFNNSGIYNVKLTCSDNAGNRSSCFYEVNTNQNACESNFSLKFTPIDYSKILKSIAFILRDAQGNVYSSVDAPLTPGSYAEIISIEEYEPNMQGQNTKKLKLQFNCGLKGDNGDVKIEDATAVIAIAY